MVRLRLLSRTNVVLPLQFTIHYGEIKTLKFEARIVENWYLQSTMVRLRRQQQPLEIHFQNWFTIHYGEIKTSSYIADFSAVFWFTIHYGEIKTRSGLPLMP